MAVYRLDRKGIDAVARKLRRRLVAVRNSTAEAAWRYFVNFGYHAYLESGPDGKNSPGWSFYYAANWNKSVGAPNTSVISGKRSTEDKEFGEYAAELSAKKAAPPLKDAANISDNIYVTNSVHYGKWLNDGGVSDLTFTKKSHPNRFIELCKSYLENNSSAIVKNVIEQVK